MYVYRYISIRKCDRNVLVNTAHDTHTDHYKFDEVNLLSVLLGYLALEGTSKPFVGRIVFLHYHAYLYN